MPYVIRSMSTTDARPGVQPVPYHVYLMPEAKRIGAYWSQTEAQRWDTAEEAQAHLDTLIATGRLSNTGQEVVPLDAHAQGIPPYWERHR